MIRYTIHMIAVSFCVAIPLGLNCSEQKLEQSFTIIQSTDRSNPNSLIERYGAITPDRKVFVKVTVTQEITRKKGPVPTLIPPSQSWVFTGNIVSSPVMIDAFKALEKLLADKYPSVVPVSVPSASR